MLIYNVKEKIQSIIEERLIQATKKELTKKLTTIAQMLGKPIIAQSSLSTKLDDPWSLEDPFIYDPVVNIREADDDWNTSERGYYFDGLKCGLNLCVTVMSYDSKITDIKATWQGYLVYLEVDGELKAYAPFDAWEDVLNMFYQAAVARQKKREEVEKKEKAEENKRKVSQFWERFRQYWGL